MLKMAYVVRLMVRAWIMLQLVTCVPAALSAELTDLALGRGLVLAKMAVRRQLAVHRGRWMVLVDHQVKPVQIKCRMKIYVLAVLLAL